MLREIERLMRCVDSFDFFKEIAAMQGLPRAEPVDAVVQAVVEALGVERCGIRVTILRDDITGGATR